MIEEAQTIVAKPFVEVVELNRTNAGYIASLLEATQFAIIYAPSKDKDFYPVHVLFETPKGTQKMMFGQKLVRLTPSGEENFTERLEVALDGS